MLSYYIIHEEISYACIYIYLLFFLKSPLYVQHGDGQKEVGKQEEVRSGHSLPDVCLIGNCIDHSLEVRSIIVKQI